MRMRGPAASFLLALLIVTAAMVAVFVSHPSGPSEWPRLAVPIKPAWFLMFAFGGGPHGLFGKWWYDGPVTFVLALAMWWAVLEGGRRLWNVRRR